MIKPELVSPAGDLEKLKCACIYGADAVYIGGRAFSLRAGAGNFTIEEMQEGIEFAHGLNKKVYLAVNIFAHNQDIKLLPKYLQQVAGLGVDAFIISDPGVFAVAQEVAQDVPIHISTQANNCNWRTANFWAEQGAKRIVLARELSLDELKDINCQSQIETEIFVHGAICISYSGRCLLSNFLLDRDANKGDCAQPCRWSYALCEEKRPGVYLPIEEDVRGTYIMNSKDLCLLDILPELIDTGANAWKIEGRNKSSYYVSAVTRIYRAAINAAVQEGKSFYIRDSWREELTKISHRQYTTNFLLKTPNEDDYRHKDSGYIRGYDFTAIIKQIKADGLLLEQRNHFKVGDNLEVLLPNGDNFTFTVETMYDEASKQISAAPNPKQQVFIPGIKGLGADLPLPLVCRRAVRTKQK